jgi:pantoate--beta-alanine ligase
MSATILTRRAELAAAADDARRGDGRVGLVPTMGALHGGHLSLVRRAAAENTTVVVSVYVNPLQFADRADLDLYPRDLEGDVEMASAVGADMVFAPEAEEMWPEAPATTVHVAGLGEAWEGEARPGHFDGVTTIVTKLFGLAGRCYAYFGEKDFQQLVVVSRLVADLSLPVGIVGCPVVRDPDGLALSSRNSRLSAEERAVAPGLYAALLAGRRAVEDDAATDPSQVESAMAAVLAAEPRFAVDYTAVVRPDDLRRPGVVAGPVRLLAAARLGGVRLIDNLAATSPHPEDGH